MAGKLTDCLFGTIVNLNESRHVQIPSDEFEKTIRAHKLFGYAYVYLREHLSHEFADECRRHYVFQKLSAELYFSEIARLSELFARAGAGAIVYKGGAFMPQLYTDLGSRELKDVDLWVPPEKMELSGELFLSAGYKVRPLPSWEAGEGKLVYTKSDGMFFTDFEVHKKNYSFEKIPLFQISKDARGFSVPPLEEHFLMVVIHAGYQHTFTELKWWIDIIRLLRKYGEVFDWKKLADLARTHQMHRLLSNVLRIAKQVVPDLSYPQDLFDGLRVASFTPEFLLKPQHNPIRYYWLKHALKQNMARTLRYDWFWLRSQFASILE